MLLESIQYLEVISPYLEAWHIKAPLLLIIEMRKNTPHQISRPVSSRCPKFQGPQYHFLKCLFGDNFPAAKLNCIPLISNLPLLLHHVSKFHDQFILFPAEDHRESFHKTWEQVVGSHPHENAVAANLAPAINLDESPDSSNPPTGTAHSSKSARNGRS